MGFFSFGACYITLNGPYAHFFGGKRFFILLGASKTKIGNIYIRIGRGIANQNRLVKNQNAQKCDFFSFKERTI